MRKHLSADTTVAYLKKEDVFDPIVDVSVLRSSHKEADTRFLLHAVSLNVYVGNVHSRDADVGLHLLAHGVKLPSRAGVDLYG